MSVSLGVEELFRRVRRPVSSGCDACCFLAGLLLSIYLCCAGTRTPLHSGRAVPFTRRLFLEGAHYNPSHAFLLLFLFLANFFHHHDPKPSFSSGRSPS